MIRRFAEGEDRRRLFFSPLAHHRMIAGVDEQFHVRQLGKQLYEEVFDALTPEEEHAVIFAV